METSIQKFVAISYLVIGLSHIFQPRAWTRFFMMFRDKGEVGSLLSALLHFPMGVLIVSFHNVWSGIPLIVTIMGWGLVIKGLIYFTYPKHGVRVLSRVSMERSWEFVVAGVVAVVLSGVIIYPLLGKW